MNESNDVIDLIADAVATARDLGKPINRSEFRIALGEARRNLNTIEEQAAQLPRVPCIVIVDDDSIWRRTLVRLAKAAGFGEIRAYWSVADYRAATGLCPLSDLPDLLITDHDLSDGNSHDVLEVLEPSTRHGLRPYVIVHSSHTDVPEDDRIQVLVRKGDDFALAQHIKRGFIQAQIAAGKSVEN